MGELSSRHLAVGGFLAALGASSLAVGALAPGALPAHVLAMPGPTLALVVGGVLVVGGLLVMALAYRRVEPELTIVPAHVAFSSKSHAREEEVPLPARRAARAPTAVPPEIASLDAQIREITREINKAGVMLATGKLSRDGYAQYVDDLKRQRGDLEAARIDIELKRHHA